MFGFLTGGITGKIIIGFVILVVIGLGLWYFTYSQNQIQILAGNAAKLELSVETQKNTINIMIEKQKKSAKELKFLYEKFRLSDNENKKLVKMLAKHRANIKDIINKKATLYERLINRGTKKVLEEFEAITDPETYNENPTNNITE